MSFLFSWEMVACYLCSRFLSFWWWRFQFLGWLTIPTLLIAHRSRIWCMCAFVCIIWRSGFGWAIFWRSSLLSFCWAFRIMFCRGWRTLIVTGTPARRSVSRSLFTCTTISLTRFFWFLLIGVKWTVKTNVPKKCKSSLRQMIKR